MICYTHMAELANKFYENIKITCNKLDISHSTPYPYHQSHTPTGEYYKIRTYVLLLCASVAI
jgi:hypothetical protein